MKVVENYAIDRVTVREVTIPYATPFQISGGVSYSRKSLIVELWCDGTVGYGESAPFVAPFYSSETLTSAKAMLSEWLIPKIAGTEVESIESLNTILSSGIRGNNFAKAGIETAYWDLVAKKNHLSLKELVATKLKTMGTSLAYQRSGNIIESGVSIGIPEDLSIDTLDSWIRSYRDDGFRRIKLKVKPGWDLKPLERAREILGDHFLLWPDANASYNLDKHMERLEAMDEYNCCFIEQPLHHDDILDHSTLGRHIRTPICLDESLKSERIAKQVIETDGPKVWNIKIQRVGGLYEACRIYSLASRRGVEVWGGTMPESGIGAAAIMALASFEGFQYPACIEPSRRWYGDGRDLIEIVMNSDGIIRVTEDEGIGAINESNYRQFGKSVYEWRR